MPVGVSVCLCFVLWWLMELRASDLLCCMTVRPVVLCQFDRKLQFPTAVCNVCVSMQAHCVNASMFVCVCLTRGQLSLLPATLYEPSFPSMWHLLASTDRNRRHWGQPWWMMTTRFVFVCVGHLCKDKSIANMQIQTEFMNVKADICMWCMHSSMLDPKELTGYFGWYGTEKQREGSPRHCLTDKWA